MQRETYGFILLLLGAAILFPIFVSSIKFRRPKMYSRAEYQNAVFEIHNSRRSDFLPVLIAAICLIIIGLFLLIAPSPLSLQ